MPVFPLVLGTDKATLDVGVSAPIGYASRATRPRTWTALVDTGTTCRLSVQQSSLLIDRLRSDLFRSAGRAESVLVLVPTRFDSASAAMPMPRVDGSPWRPPRFSRPRPTLMSSSGSTSCSNSSWCGMARRVADSSPIDRDLRLESGPPRSSTGRKPGGWPAPPGRPPTATFRRSGTSAGRCRPADAGRRERLPLAWPG